MIQYLDQLDHRLFLFLNGMHNPFFDHLMLGATRSLIWLPVYLVFFWLVVREYRWQTIWILIFAALMILASDQLSNVVKDSVQRLRPSREPGLAVHLVEAYKGGLYGFYSAHASNTFAVSLFLIILLRRSFRWFFIPVIAWALFMSYTRIYLGVHFPGDTLAGILAGSVIGLVFGFLCVWVIRKTEKRLPRK